MVIDDILLRTKYGTTSQVLTVVALYHEAQLWHTACTIKFNGILHLDTHTLPSGPSNRKL